MAVYILEFPVLLLSVGIPLVAALLSLVIGERARPKLHAALNGTSLLLSALLILYAAFSAGLYGIAKDPMYWNIPGIGTFAFVLDPVVFPVAISIAAVTGMVAFYSEPYMDHRYKELEEEGVKAPGWGTYYFLYTLFALSMIGSVLTTNTIEFYIFLELTLIPSFLLIAFYGYGDRVRIAILYLIWTHVGALLFLVGALAVGSKVGFDFLNPVTCKPLLGLGEKALSGSMLWAVLVVMTIGLLVKMAVFGVHIWLPYAHAEAPTPISALLSPNLIGIGGLMLFRIVTTLFPSSFASFSVYLYGWAFLTMIYGGLMALVQTDFKRLLAYSSISQMGYILLGLASATDFGVSGAILHYLVHAFGKAVLFMVAGVLIATLHGLRQIPKMGGLAQKMPYTAALALLGFMHITGIPPTAGLWSEYLIVRGAIDRCLSEGSTFFIVTGVLLLIAIGLSTAYAFLTMKRAFYGSLPDHLRGSHEAQEGLLVPIAVLAALGILSFFLASVFIDPLISYLHALRG